MIVRDLSKLPPKKPRPACGKGGPRRTLDEAEVRAAYAAEKAKRPTVQRNARLRKLESQMRAIERRSPYK
jgi:hypothetical protein